MSSLIGSAEYQAEKHGTKLRWRHLMAMRTKPKPRTLKQIRQAFMAQRASAAQRGIEWRLSFNDWLMLWGNKITRRGFSYGEGRYLVMGRYGDEGEYSLENCYITPHWENVKGPEPKP